MREFINAVIGGAILAAIFTLIATPKVAQSFARYSFSSQDLYPDEPRDPVDWVARVRIARAGAYSLVSCVPISLLLNSTANWIVMPFLAPALWYAFYRLQLKLGVPGA